MTMIISGGGDSSGSGNRRNIFLSWLLCLASVAEDEGLIIVGRIIRACYKVKYSVYEAATISLKWTSLRQLESLMLIEVSY